MLKQAYEIRNNILNEMKNTLLKNEGSYNFDIASAVAKEMSEIYVDLEDLKLQMFPETCTREPFISYHLTTFGLVRLGATFATGEIEITGKVGTQIPLGTLVVSRLGALYKTVNNVMLDSYGKAKTSIIAESSGEIGNCSDGDITGFNIAIANIYSVTNKLAVSGGAEIEPIELAKKRLKFKATRPSHSGNKNDYYNWAFEVGGIGKVSIFGAGEHEILGGNVDLYFSTLEGQTPSTEMINSVVAHLNDNDRIPVGVQLNVKGFVPLITNITFDKVSVKKGNWTKESWITEFKKLVQLGYATDNFIVNSVVPFPKISVIALDLDGTIIYDDMKINGSISNLNIAFNQTPVIGEVTITTFEEVI
ncbi:MAG: baseplate J/gp47 family protein [Fusobacteriaceae bacterium]